MTGWSPLACHCSLLMAVKSERTGRMASISRCRIREARLGRRWLRWLAKPNCRSPERLGHRRAFRAHLAPMLDLLAEWLDASVGRAGLLASHGAPVVAGVTRSRYPGRRDNSCTPTGRTQEVRSFRELREALGITQTDLAKLANMTQSEVSKFETRDDHRIERMREVVEALGGKLEVIAVLGDKRVRVA
jgi:DNA-binding XRE family transcriptional regulator